MPLTTPDWVRTLHAEEIDANDDDDDARSGGLRQFSSSSGSGGGGGRTLSLMSYSQSRDPRRSGSGRRHYVSGSVVDLDGTIYSLSWHPSADGKDVGKDGDGERVARV